MLQVFKETGELADCFERVVRLSAMRYKARNYGYYYDRRDLLQSGRMVAVEIRSKLEAIGDERRACAFLARSCLYRYLIDDRVYNGKKTRPKLVFGADVALKEAESRLEREPTCDYRLEALERAYNALIRRGIRRRAFAVKKTLEGYTTREIAEMEGVDMKAIQGRLTHFYEQVRDEEAFLRGRAKSKEETK